MTLGAPNRGYENKAHFILQPTALRNPEQPSTSVDLFLLPFPI